MYNAIDYLPAGMIEFIGGVRCYVGTPSTEYANETAVLFLTDVYGIDPPNGQLLVDEFAQNGFKTIAIDYLNGDPVPYGALDSPDFNYPAWLARHGSEQTRPNIDKVMAALKEDGVTDFAVTGYCFGGRYSFDLAFDNLIKVTVVAHPSLLNIPDDLEKYKDVATAPLLLNCGMLDDQFTVEDQAAADQIIGGGKQFTPNYCRKSFKGCGHGFALRGNTSDPKVRAGKEGAFKDTVEFFRKYL
ncbi:hypothetical protein ID866_10486 [Astraeus odoratus]|nr:hypothetical protein ID866_10486 [Astraeus odoratus]